MKEGILKQIWLKRMRGGPMDPVDWAKMVVNQGLVGNADQGGKRQVTIIEQAVWTALMDQLDADLDPVMRRANLLVDGVQLAHSRGRILKIGVCRLRIYGETKPCQQMDQALSGLRTAMYDNWGGGAFGEILKDGEIRVGDVVQWVDEA